MIKITLEDKVDIVHFIILALATIALIQDKGNIALGLTIIVIIDDIRRKIKMKKGNK